MGDLLRHILIILKCVRMVIGQYLGAGGEVISHLNISSVSTVDGGQYSCLVTNSVGTARHSASINIYGLTEIF